MVQSLYLIFHWNYLPYLVSKKKGFSGRCRNLKRRLRSLGKGQVIMLAFSSGGRAASLVVDEFPDQRVICIGYPFKKPTVPDEPERYLHLSNLKTPMLIIQGDKDEYGGPEIADRYSLSPSIELFYVDADHRYRMEQGEWDKVTGKIDSVLANPGYRRNPETALSPV